MNTAGIICEYNPFHNGHKLHMEETRAQIGPGGGILCVMSGNYVQRGDVAVFSKHARAKAAVRSGADLVVELPTPWAISSAEGFARGAVAVLAGTGVCTHLSFGCECGSAEPLAALADTLLSEPWRESLKKELSQGISFAKARQNAAAELVGEAAALLEKPNNSLAVEYLKAARTQGAPLIPLPVLRKGAEHDGEKPTGGIASASYLRERMRSGGETAAYIPAAAAEVFAQEMAAGRGPVRFQTVEAAVLARLRTMTDEDYRNLPFDAEGLSDRLMRFARSGGSVEEILEKTKTKRYALSRLRRMVLAAYLGITAADVSGTPPYIRVLALNDRGRELLREMGRRATLPVIVKPAEAKALPESARHVFELEAAATSLYVLAFSGAENRAGDREWTESPVYVESGK